MLINRRFLFITIQHTCTMKIYYGNKDSWSDVTQVCFEKLRHHNYILIPACDINRTVFFGDPLFGIVKLIRIVSSTDQTYDQTANIKIDIETETIEVKSYTDKTVENKLLALHKQLTFKYGSLRDEFPEQRMVAHYFTGKETVLEIGGNIGRNSLIIASLVDNTKFVVLECDPISYNQLVENRDGNQFEFAIENAALSEENLIQKGWETRPSDTLPDGYNWVNTISYQSFQDKYPLQFDTLVLDCEGAFYFILKSMPTILDNIKLILVENDYTDMKHKIFVDNHLRSLGFYRDYVEPTDLDWLPCRYFFFEVWTRGT